MESVNQEILDYAQGDALDWVSESTHIIRSFAKNPDNHQKVKKMCEARLTGGASLIGLVLFRNRETLSLGEQEALFKVMTHLIIRDEALQLKEFIA